MCDESCKRVVLFTEDVLCVLFTTVLGRVELGLEVLCFVMRLILRLGVSVFKLSLLLLPSAPTEATLSPLTAALRNFDEESCYELSVTGTSRRLREIMLPLFTVCCGLDVSLFFFYSCSSRHSRFCILTPDLPEGLLGEAGETTLLASV